MWTIINRLSKGFRLGFSLQSSYCFSGFQQPVRFWTIGYPDARSIRFRRILSPFLTAKNPSLAHAIRAQGVHAVTDVSSIPLLLPLIVDALQSNDSAIRSAATKAISNIVLKLDRNTYKRIPIQNWNSIETQLERANTLLSLQSQHRGLQEEIDALLRRVNTGEWKRLAKLRNT